MFRPPVAPARVRWSVWSGFGPVHCPIRRTTRVRWERSGIKPWVHNDRVSPSENGTAPRRRRRQLKREARLDKTPDDEDDVEAEDAAPQPTESAEAIMDKLAKLHEAFDDDKIEFEDFEEQKADLMARMPLE